MEVRLFICSESFALDAARNSLSLFHILEEINSPVFPVALPQMSVVAMFVREEEEPNEPQVRLRIQLDGQELFLGPMGVNFQGHLRTRSLGNIQALVLPRPGRLSVSVEQNDHALASWLVAVNQIGQPNLQLQNPLVA